MWFAEILFQKFQIFHNIVLNMEHFGGWGHFEKHAYHEKMNRNRRKSRENSRDLFNSIFKIEQKREFVRAL